MRSSHDNIPQMEPWFDDKESNAVFNYMKSGGWVTEFKKTRELEEKIRNYIKSDHCSIVSNGTVGLFLALIASGVGRGDDVLVPAYTMAASANAIILAGAKVAFSDIDSDSLCLNLDNIKQTITPNTKAIILVTINGRYPNDLDDIVSFCKKKNIVLIEDAAQSLGSFKGDRHLGTFGDVGIFSFAMPKIITMGQGGAVVTNNEDIINKIRKLRDFGRDQSGSDHYLTMGWNFKFTDIQAVIGLEQVKKLPWRIKRKKEIYALYRKMLKDVQSIKFLPTNLLDTTPMFVDILVPQEKRSSLVAFLKEKGINSRIVYPALHKEPVYNRTETYPIAEKVAKEGLWLPSSSKLTDKDIEFICKLIINFFNK